MYKAEFSKIVCTIRVAGARLERWLERRSGKWSERSAPVHLEISKKLRKSNVQMFESYNSVGKSENDCYNWQSNLWNSLEVVPLDF